jgi:4-amino-4-deoxy-L-arabinose transferase-like glycosyltransferase
MALLDNHPPTEFPNRLCRPDLPVAGPPRPRAAVLGLLLLACLLPRLWVGVQQDSLCPDAVEYLEIADALQQGNQAGAFAYLDLNVYPPLLLLLRYLGGPHWVIACGAWSLAMATLTVLPLYGLVRRQFRQRIAVLACLLYALHPRLILHSPLILRDPTFWFFFLLALYLQWRAVTELRWWLFLTAGAATFLAIHTRSEGWMLLLPLATWGTRRLWVLSERRLRWRLIGGIVTCLAVIPLTTVLANVAIFRSQAKWQTASTRHFAYAWLWLRGEQEIDAAALGSAVPAGERAADAGPEALRVKSPLIQQPVVRIHQRVFVKFVKVFTYVYGLIILAGVWRLRRNLWRTDTLPFFFIMLAMLAGIWIRYNVLPIDERYYFTILLVSLPGLGIGAMQIAEWLDGLVRRVRRCGADCQSAGLRLAILSGLLVAVAVASAIDAVRVGGNMFRAWREQAELGRWILHERGAQQPLTGNNEEMRLVAYYAQGYIVPLSIEQLQGLPPTWPGPWVSPGVMVFWDDRRHTAAPSEHRQILEGQSEIPYRQVPPGVLPESCLDLTVLVHRPAELPPHAVARLPLP